MLTVTFSYRSHCYAIARVSRCQRRGGGYEGTRVRGYEGTRVRGYEGTRVRGYKGRPRQLTSSSHQGFMGGTEAPPLFRSAPQKQVVFEAPYHKAASIFSLSWKATFPFLSTTVTTAHCPWHSALRFLPQRDHIQGTLFSLSPHQLCPCLWPPLMCTSRRGRHQT